MIPGNQTSAAKTTLPIVYRKPLFVISGQYLKYLPKCPLRLQMIIDEWNECAPSLSPETFKSIQLSQNKMFHITETDQTQLRPRVFSKLNNSEAFSFGSHIILFNFVH